MSIKGKDVKVLVAEDDELSQQVMSHILKSINIDFDLVSNGNEVLSAINSKHYDMIFMDISMPEKNGIETSIEINKMELEIPIVAITGYSTKNEKNKIKKAGIDTILVKPIRIHDVYNIIEEKIINSNLNKTSDGLSRIYKIMPESFKGEEDLYIELLCVFIQDVRSRIKIIEESCELKDWERLKKEVHSMKGSASYVNATIILNITDEINTKLKNKNYENIDTMIENLKISIRDFIDSIEDAIKN